MKAAIYARVSFEEQIEGYSLDAQIRAFRAFVQERDWIIYREYIDKGVSARTVSVTGGIDQSQPLQQLKNFCVRVKDSRGVVGIIRAV